MPAVSEPDLHDEARQSRPAQFDAQEHMAYDESVARTACHPHAPTHETV